MSTHLDRIVSTLPDPSRRQFLKTGVAGTLWLGIASSGMALTGCSQKETHVCPDCSWLSPSDRIMLIAIIPVMLKGALPGSEEQRDAAIQSVIAAFDFTVTHFSPSARKEIRQLLDLLQFPFTRVLLTGVMSPWHQKDELGVRSFLTRWQTSRFSLFRSGYQALHDLIIGAWYANPDSWRRISYPGPPKLS